MIKEIRQYIKESIACVDPNMKMDRQPLTNDTIPTTQIDSTYTITFGSVSLDRQDTSIEGVFPVSVQIFRKLGTNPNESFDTAFVKALSIYSTISDQERLFQSGYIKAINNVDLTANNVASDDNTAVFDMQFNMICEFTILNGN